MKSCPFCGSDRFENLDAASNGADPVHCIDCGAHGPCMLESVDAEDGVEAWDVRAVEVSS